MKSLLYDGALKERIRINLGKFSSRTEQNKKLKKAAVAITLVNLGNDPELYDIPYRDGSQQDAAVLLTRRAARLKRHAGQWALPGGKMEENELPEDTALRELHEEVGLRLDRDSILGRLDDYPTRSGFIISPIVLWGGSNLEMFPNYEEVASIHRIPLTEFLRDDAPIFQEMPGSENPVLLMPVGNGSIASPTAALLYQFREVAILGKSVRVSHFEQPFFAWQ